MELGFGSIDLEPGQTSPGRISTLTGVGAVVVPMVVAAALIPLRGDLAHTAGMILVLPVVTFGVAKGTSAGALAAVSAAIGFDLFLVASYLHPGIDRAEGVVATVTLLPVGLAAGFIGSRSGASQSRSAALQPATWANRQLGRANDRNSQTGPDRSSDLVRRCGRSAALQACRPGGFLLRRDLIHRLRDGRSHARPRRRGRNVGGNRPPHTGRSPGRAPVSTGRPLIPGDDPRLSLRGRLLRRQPREPRGTALSGGGLLVAN